MTPRCGFKRSTGFPPVPHLFYSRLGQPCYVLIAGRMPVPHFEHEQEYEHEGIG
jgi:hypothetical protein